MAVLGKKPVRTVGNYQNHPMYALAQKFSDVAKGMLQEEQINIFMEPGKALVLESTNESLRNFYTEDSNPDFAMNTEKEKEEHIQEMEALYDNNREALLEYAPMAGYNPVIGMGFPIHKNIMMSCIFDKGAIQKAVAATPRFTFDMEYRYLIDVNGNEIDIQKYQEKIKTAMDEVNPLHKVELTLPESGFTDVLGKIGASSLDNLSTETYISRVQVTGTFKKGDVLPSTGNPSESEDPVTEDVWLDTNIIFTPSYGDNDRICIGDVVLPEYAYKTVEVDSTQQVIKVDKIAGTMKKNRFTINSINGVIKKVELSVRKDTSNAMVKTCSVDWRIKSDYVEIPNASPINVTISPEEIKDIGALYNVNQLTKVMSIIKDILENNKDDTIKEKLDESYIKLDPSQKIYGKFDFAPRDGYALDHVTWRSATFLDALDTYVTQLCQVLRDPNVTITIFGRPDLIRKIQPTQYDFKSPSQVGPIELEFVKTVVTSDKRVYQFVSSQKLNDSDQLIIVLNPRNTDRVIYRIYDYQFCVTNDIRNWENPTLPSVHAFERWLFKEYQPVQGRIDILNPTGLKS